MIMVDDDKRIARPALCLLVGALYLLSTLLAGGHVEMQPQHTELASVPTVLPVLSDVSDVGGRRMQMIDPRTVEIKQSIYRKGDSLSCAKRRAATSYIDHCSRPSSQCKPRPDFPGRIIYMSMGSASYIGMLEYFVQTLFGFGIEEDAVGIVCIDDGCYDHFTKRYPSAVIVKVDDDVIRDTECWNWKTIRQRCRVSLGKGLAIMQQLREGNAVYFVDADVFFFQHPYESLSVSDPNLDLYVHSDGEGNGANFGGILAYPSQFTLALFEHIDSTYRETFDWDQKIFNDWLSEGKNALGRDFVCGDPFDFEFLDRKSHSQINFCRGELRDVDLANIDAKTVHATCVEGSATKRYSLLSIWGSPVGDYYKSKKTVGVEGFQGRTIEEWSRVVGSREAVDSWMKPLAYIARVTQRAIRLGVPVSTIGKKFFHPSQPYRIVSADNLSNLNISVVEPAYWERALTTGGRVPVVKTLNDFDVGHPLNIAEFVISALGSDADELTFSLDELIEFDKNWVDLVPSYQRSFACAHVGEFPKPSCLKVCDGEHF